MLGQTPEIAPADKRLYALRDVTATVESIPLIAASIMSKKLAEGLNGLVLDVKTGSGAFLKEPERAIELARTMIGLGEARGCPTVALLTAMDRPLGRACGNALEVEEAIEGLRGSGPADLMEVTYALGAEMLVLVGAAPSAPRRAGGWRTPVASGRALETFARDHRGPGGQSRGGRRPRRAAAGAGGRGLPRRAGRRRGRRSSPGGWAAPSSSWAAGGPGSRTRSIRRSASSITVKPGDPVRAGEPIASVFARDEAGHRARASRRCGRR